MSKNIKPAASLNPSAAPKQDTSEIIKKTFEILSHYQSGLGYQLVLGFMNLSLKFIHMNHESLNIRKSSKIRELLKIDESLKINDSSKIHDSSISKYS